MAGTERFEDSIGSWLEETAPRHLPARVLATTFERTRRTRQESGWRAVVGRPHLPRFVPALGGAAAVLLAVGLALNLGLVAVPGEPTTQPSATPSNKPATPVPLEPEVTALLNGFLDARVAGEGAQQYLSVPELDVPLLYTTTSGSAYEGGGFEEVRGYEWPLRLRAFMVSLEVDGLVVVNQLFFMPPDVRPRLQYVPDGFGTDIAPTTEGGQPVARPYEAVDGEVTLQVAHPWVSIYDSHTILRIPEGSAVQGTTDGGQRIGWDRLVVIADPVPVGTHCSAGAPADANALAESIESLAFFEATAPVAIDVGATEALMMDVVTGAKSVCAESLYGQQCPALQVSCRMRVYLFDVPDGLSMRILAIAIIAPESRFERAVDTATPIINSIEFHVP